MTTAVSVRDLSKEYRTPGGRVRALADVSFDVERGALCALVGPSGSGKSTLLALIGGLDTPTSGEVVVGGVALHALSPARRSRVRASHIGFVFQSNNLIPVLTAAENVALPLTLGTFSERERARRVDALMDDLGLRTLAKQRPGELSGGQQQRVGIARALVTEPTIVLADEPTAHLDSETARDVMHLLRSINLRRGTTFLVATHDLNVQAFTDTHLVLRDGSLVHAITEGSSPCQPCSISASATCSAIHAVP